MLNPSAHIVGNLTFVRQLPWYEPEISATFLVADTAWALPHTSVTLLTVEKYSHLHINSTSLSRIILPHPSQPTPAISISDLIPSSNGTASRTHLWLPQVPVDVTGVPAMYIFVDIGIDVHHLVETVRFNFTPGTQLSLAGTIQFASSIQARLT